MMIATETIWKFDNRRHGAILLAERLMEYKDSRAIIVAIPKGGIVTGYYLSEALGLPLEVMPTKRIERPSDSCKSIGSVTANTVFINTDVHDIPRNYIDRQIRMLQYAARKEKTLFYPGGNQETFENRRIILVDDFVRSGDSMMACLNEIKSWNPEEIVVAAPVMCADAALELDRRTDGAIYLELIDRCQDVFYKDLPAIDSDKALKYFRKARVHGEMMKVAPFPET